MRNILPYIFALYGLTLFLEGCRFKPQVKTDKIEGKYSHLKSEDTIEISKNYYIHYYMAEGKVKKDTGSWELSEERISQDESVKIVKLLNFCSVTSYSKDSKNGNGFDNNLTIYSQNDTNFWIEANISNPDGLYLSTPDAAEPDYTQVVYKKMN